MVIYPSHAVSHEALERLSGAHEATHASAETLRKAVLRYSAVWILRSNVDRRGGVASVRATSCTGLLTMTLCGQPLSTTRGKRCRMAAGTS